MTEVIAVVNSKGGVGKTSSTHALGESLYDLSCRVLLIDMDPSRNLTIACQIEDQDLVTVYDGLKFIATEGKQGRSMDDGIYNYLELTDGDEVQRCIHIIPGSISMANFDIEMASIMGRENLLRYSLEGIVSSNYYDYVLIDCPPTLGLPQVVSLVAADSALIPVKMGFFDHLGLNDITNLIYQVQRRLNRSLVIKGIFFTMSDKTKLSEALADNVREAYGKESGIRVFRTAIRNDIKVKEAPNAGKSVVRYAPRSRATEDYRLLAQELRQAS